MNTLFSLKLKYTNFLFAFVVLTGCLSSSSQETNCESSYKNAQKRMAEYVHTSNKDFLIQALNSLDTSFGCHSMKTKSINLKITIFSLLKDNIRALSFLQSLKESDFQQPYKKRMFENIFKGAEFELKGDTGSAKEIYRQTDSSIKIFLLATDSKTFTKEIYSDLIYTRSKFMPRTEIQNEIDSLKLKFPNDTLFLSQLLEAAFISN